MNLTSGVGKKIWGFVGAIVLIASFGGAFLAFNEMWEETPECIANAKSIGNLEKDMVAGMQQFQMQQQTNYYDMRLQNLFDQLRQAEYDLRSNPNNQAIRDRIRYLEEEIRATRKYIEELRKR